MSHMIELTRKQHYAAFELLITNGWVFDHDRSDPRPEIRGWFIHPENKPHRMGDPKSMYYAARVTMSLYTDFTRDDLPKLSYCGFYWIWPDGSRT